MDAQIETFYKALRSRQLRIISLLRHKRELQDKRPIPAEEIITVIGRSPEDTHSLRKYLHQVSIIISDLAATQKKYLRSKKISLYSEAKTVRKLVKSVNESIKELDNILTLQVTALTQGERLQFVEFCVQEHNLTVDLQNTRRTILALLDSRELHEKAIRQASEDTKRLAATTFFAGLTVTIITGIIGSIYIEPHSQEDLNALIMFTSQLIMTSPSMLLWAEHASPKQILTDLSAE